MTDTDLPLQPPLAGDERFQDMGKLAQRISDIDYSCVLVYLIDTVDASVLPHLAKQFHILGEGWQFARTDLEKRRLLKIAIPLHRHKGTPWAIEKVLEMLSLQGKVSEWFDYGGQAYCFKVDVDLTDRGMDEDTFYALTHLVNEYKNARSALESLSIYLSNISAVPKMAAAMLAGEVATVYPYELTELNQSSSTPRFGVGFWSVETTTLFPQ